MNRKDKDYLEWLREQDCICCGLHTDRMPPHHFIGEGGMSGMGLKAPDLFAMPMCLDCHNDIHRAVKGWKEIQRKALIDTLCLAVREGKICNGGEE